MPASWDSYFADALNQLDAAHLRRRRVAERSRDIIDFGSNDYLGLSVEPAVVAAARSAARDRWGSAASAVLRGYQQPHAELERALARWFGRDAAVVFSSGFGCNVGVVSCLATQGDLIVSDQLNHASLIDGCRLSRAERLIYPHRDVGFVREYLGSHRHRYGRVLLLTESIFSMDGDAAPLQELVDIAEDFDCGLVVDEAHAAGVYGEQGSGLLEELRLEGRTLAKLGTLSKALGSIGGYVVGSRELTEFVVNRCRSYLFSTAPPAASMAAALAALCLARQMGEQRSRLRAAARGLRQQLGHLQGDAVHDESPIVPIIVGSAERALAASQELAEGGFYVPAIRPPTVPPGTARLRVSLSLRHSTEQLDALAARLQAIMR